MQNTRLSTCCVMLNPIGPSVPLQARMPASSNLFIEPNHFEEELLEENGLLGDLLEDKIEIEVLPNGGRGSARMSTINCLFLQKLKCSLQEKTLERLFESFHLAIQKSKVIPKCAGWNYVKVFYFSIFNLKS